MSNELSGNTRTLVNSYLMPMLNGLEDIEIHDEEGRLKEDSAMNTVEYAFQNWNDTFTPTAIKNNTELVEDTDYTTDYDNGTLEMTTALVVGDVVRCSYRFTLFNPATLGDFYARSLTFFNGLHPKTTYTLDSFPVEWTDGLTESAYKYCLQTIMITASSWKGALVFRDPAQMIGVCTTLLADVGANLQARLQNIKGRSLLIPKSVSSGRRTTPTSVNGTNFRQFTVWGA